MVLEIAKKIGKSPQQVFYPFPYFEVQIVDVPGKKLSPWFKVWINPKLVPEASLPYFRDYASPAERNLTSRKYQRVKGEILNWGEKAEDISLKYFPSHDSALPRVKGGSAMQDLFRSKLMHLKPLLLGSMYFWSWLIQLNRSYKKTMGNSLAQEFQ